MYILDFSIHTHTNYCWSTPEAENPAKVSLSKGECQSRQGLSHTICKRQYIRGKPCSNSNGNQRALDLSHEEDYSLVNPISLHLYSSVSLTRVQKWWTVLKQQMTDSQSISQSVGRSVGRSLSPRLVRIQKAKPQPNHTACATVRNRRNWTIIIKYHHFVTIKGIWKSFFPPISLLVLLCRRLLFFFFDTV